MPNDPVTCQGGGGVLALNDGELSFFIGLTKCNGIHIFYDKMYYISINIS